METEEQRKNRISPTAYSAGPRLTKVEASAIVKLLDVLTRTGLEDVLEQVDFTAEEWDKLYEKLKD